MLITYKLVNGVKIFSATTYSVGWRSGSVTLDETLRRQLLLRLRELHCIRPRSSKKASVITILCAVYIYSVLHSDLSVVNSLKYLIHS